MLSCRVHIALNIKAAKIRKKVESDEWECCGSKRRNLLQLFVFKNIDGVVAKAFFKAYLPFFGLLFDGFVPLGV